MKYRVILNPLQQFVVGNWPETKIKDGIVVDKETPEIAVHEVADEFGIAHHCLKAVPVE
jgi:hypothetical protein